MEELLEKFNKIYKLPIGTPFRRVALEDALVEYFGDISFHKYEGWTDRSTKKEYRTRYGAGAKENWGMNEVSTGSLHTGKNIEEALINLFILYGVEPDYKEEFYKNDFSEEFHDIVKKVYADIL